MKFWTTAVLLFIAGCNSSPTAPTPNPPVTSVPPPVVVAPPPVVVTPPPVLFPPNDARFDLTFYRQFVHNALETPLQPLRRQPEAPRIYLRTVYDNGAPIDPITLDHTAAALINTAGALTGVFGLAGLERGTDTRQGQRGWITVRWSDRTDVNACGTAAVGGGLIMLYPRNNCRCPGHAAIMEMATIKHELGHALGYWHTDNVNDLMYRQSFGECDKVPSAREVYHAALAYTRPIGSLAP